MPAHTHNDGFNTSAGAVTGGGAVGTRGVTTSTGGGNAHNNLQPSIAINFIIKT